MSMLRRLSTLQIALAVSIGMHAITAPPPLTGFIATNAGGADAKPSQPCSLTNDTSVPASTCADCGIAPRFGGGDATPTLASTAPVESAKRMSASAYTP